MKLRIRSMATRETIRITAPDAASLLDLKSLIAASLVAASTNPNPDPIAPDSIHLSLNQLDELVAPNASDPLSALGLTSGDLLFFSFAPFRQTLANKYNPSQVPNLIPPGSSSGASSSSNNPIDKPNSESSVNPSPINQSAVPMELDAGPPVLKESDSARLIPGFLVQLMDTESEEDAGILGRVVLLTHAALLDMGFTLFNGAGSKLPQDWASHASSLSLEYTIPDFVNQVQAINDRVAVTKLSVLGNLVTVYGYLGGIKPDIYRFSLDLAKVASLLSLNLKSMCKSEQEQLMEIFRSVKDGVALPLMIDLCLKNGLPLPPCFMFLSIDIRAKILDLLSGADVVRTGSTCKEVRNLSLDDNMWRQKFEREFSNSLNNNISMPAGTWKERYKSAYIAKNSASRFRTRRSNWFQIRPSVAERPIGPGGHFILGGNADRFPVFGAGIEEVGPIAFRRRGPDGRQVSPHCFTEN
ncbi:F-box protein SKIP22 [Rhynchospora pubera]|uniref:F-box protein SKIP22 n=1 Tax=Rhynchospora pubera TaxID=906938 RepID=A0AAV8HW35_9POAL|nr:F-box protein SKIP22 [Rhynchospora pubera]